MRVDRFIWQDGDFEWLDEKQEGGPGSGNFGHSGRPGQVGGSGGGGGRSAPQTEEGALKSVMEQMDGMISKNLKGVSGYRLVMEGGQFFTPQERPKDIIKGQNKLCYMNAGTLALSNEKKYTYVEGFALAKGLGNLPFAHAWVVDKKGGLIETTWSEAGTAYYGIPFRPEYLRQVLRGNKHWGLIPEWPQSERDREVLKGGFPKGAIKR